MFFDKTCLQKPYWVMIENMSSNKAYMQLILAFKNKDVGWEKKVRLEESSLNELC